MTTSLFAVVLPLLLAYGATLAWCIDRWNAPTQYFAHCWLLPPLAAFVAWQRRAVWSLQPRRPERAGLWLLGPALLLHGAGALLMVDSWSAASLVLAVPGTAWLVLGRQRLRGQWPLVWLVLFVVPAPLFVEGRLAFVLKELATGGGTVVANWLGADVVRSGAYLQPRGLAGGLYVADACGGLRSLLAMLTLSYCLAFFLGSARWSRRLVLLLAAPLLAVGANTLRIAALCLLARWWGVSFAEGTGHTLANAVEWAVLLLSLLQLDRWLTRREPATAAPIGPTLASSTRASSTLAIPTSAPAQPFALRSTAVVLWLLAGPLLWMSAYRPQPATTARAQTLPEQIGGFVFVPRSPEREARFQRDLPSYRELLGTGDFVWRRYVDADGGAVNVVALFHDTNWKSVHPPRICIEGSDMDIEQDELVPAFGGSTVVSRIVARGRSDGWRYVTLSLFGTADWLSGDYWQFTRHHLPLALLRANQSGFLLRVEAPIRKGESDAVAAERAARFLQALLPMAQERVR